jgi:hypothetical protein
MKRSSFLKSVLGIAVAPKIVIEATVTEAALPVVTASDVANEFANNKRLYGRYVSAIDFIDSREIGIYEPGRTNISKIIK